MEPLEKLKGKKRKLRIGVIVNSRLGFVGECFLRKETIRDRVKPETK